MQLSSNTYCVSAWSDVVIETNGNFRVCCLEEVQGDQDYCVDENNVIMNVMTHSIRQAINSVNHKNLRKAQMDNIQHPMCNVCWKREQTDSKVPSIRKFRNANRGFEVSNECDGESNISWLPLSLDLRLSNLCNCKCIACGPRYSTLWYEDHVALTSYNAFSIGTDEYKIVNENNRYTSNLPKWYDSETWWQQFDEVAPTLKQISFTGGEPFVQPAHDTIINKLIERGYASNIQLRYVSNFFSINSKILEKLDKFKHVSIVASIDDVHERHNLIRFPSNFDRVVKNINLMKEKFNIELNFINTTVGLYNILSPIRLWEFFRSDRMYVGFVRNPSCYNIAYAPRALREFVREEYEKSDIPDKYKKQIIGYLDNNIPDELQQKMQIYAFVDRMDKLDSIRSTNWKETFPEIAKRITDV